MKDTTIISPSVLRNRTAPARSPWLSSTSVRAVWKLVARAPSPRKRRNRLGTRNAVRNASKTPEVSPKSAAASISRAYPSTRLTSVRLDTSAVRSANRRCRSGGLEGSGWGSISGRSKGADLG